jgi:hypothetical protein
MFAFDWDFGSRFSGSRSWGCRLPDASAVCGGDELIALSIKLHLINR